MYDDPPEPQDEHPLTGTAMTVASPQPEKVMRVTIEASQWDERRLADMVLGRVAEDVEKHLNSAIHKHITTAINAAVERVVEGKVMEMAEAILREGWEETDRWGERTGKKVTFAQRVNAILEHRDAYSGRSNNLTELVTKLVDEALRKDLGAEVEAARKKVREMLDTRVMEKLSTALKEGLGLRA